MKTLKELEIGDRFYPASKEGKATPTWRVVGHSLFGSRKCLNLKTNQEEWKANYLKVIKTF